MRSRRSGLFGLFGPRSSGGLDVTRAQGREVFEALGGACGATFFVWAQHHSPVRMLRESDNEPLRRQWLKRLCTGAALAGVAFAYLRRPGPAAVRARAATRGYLLEGEAPWLTSWGLADVRVPATAVIAVESARDWRERDRLATAQPNPAVLGVAATCLRLLGDVDVTGAAAAAEKLGEELRACRQHSYRLAEADPADIPALVAARAWSHDLAVRSAHALVAARGGRAMSLDDPAQRLLREAAFYSIQAQTLAGRTATLERIVGGG